MIFILAGFLLIAITLSALTSRSRLAATIATCMSCASLLGGMSYSIDGYSSNVGGIFFTALLYGMALRYYLDGAEMAKRLVNNTLYVIFMVMGALLILEYSHILPSGMFHISLRHIELLFISSWALLHCFVWLLARIGNRTPMISIPFCIFVTQTGFAIFFVPVAFGEQFPTFNATITYVLLGWFVKSAMTIASIPLIGVIAATHRRKPIPD